MKTYQYSTKISFFSAVLFLMILIPTLSRSQDTNKRVTKVKADYLIYGTEKNFTNFMQLNSFTTYKTLINEVTIFYDYGLSKGTKKKWDPSRNLLKTEIKTSYHRDPYDYSFVIEDNQDKITIYSRFYTASIGGYRGNTRGDIGYGFGHIGHDKVDVFTFYFNREELFECVKINGIHWKRNKELIRTLDMKKINYPAILFRGSFAYKIPRQLSNQRSIVLTEISLNYMFNYRVRSIASLKWFYDANVPARKQHRYDIRAGMGITYEF
ncbi:MAG: hypothetical protein M1426_04235 [Patescibacteria group bacterium]|nr:hypothetical protein [Patescibacteria group bacterium]